VYIIVSRPLVGCRGGHPARRNVMPSKLYVRLCAVVYTKNTVHILEGLVAPLMQRLEHRLGDNERCLKQLCEEKERLGEEIEQIEEELEKLMRRSPVKSTAV